MNMTDEQFERYKTIWSKTSKMDYRAEVFKILKEETDKLLDEMKTENKKPFGLGIFFSGTIRTKKEIVMNIWRKVGDIEL